MGALVEQKKPKVAPRRVMRVWPEDEIANTCINYVTRERFSFTTYIVGKITNMNFILSKDAPAYLKFAKQIINHRDQNYGIYWEQALSAIEKLIEVFLGKVVDPPLLETEKAAYRTMWSTNRQQTEIGKRMYKLARLLVNYYSLKGFVQNCLSDDQTGFYGAFSLEAEQLHKYGIGFYYA
jgi:hypothetical protein